MIKRKSEEKVKKARIIFEAGAPFSLSDITTFNIGKSRDKTNVIVRKSIITAQYKPHFFLFKREKAGQKRTNSPNSIEKNTMKGGLLEDKRNTITI